jgi:hypothetical protein
MMRLTILFASILTFYGSHIWAMDNNTSMNIEEPIDDQQIQQLFPNEVWIEILNHVYNEPKVEFGDRAFVSSHNLYHELAFQINNIQEITRAQLKVLSLVCRQLKA